jgi:hypothetical protein
VISLGALTVYECDLLQQRKTSVRQMVDGNWLMSVDGKMAIGATVREAWRRIAENKAA